MEDKYRVLYLTTTIIIGIGYVVLTLLAMLFYPENYSFLTDDFSVLGRVRTEGNLPNPISPILFLIATGSSGISLSIFWIKYRSVFIGKPRHVALAGSITGVISSISLIGVGLFPMDALQVVHGFFAILFFVLNAVTFLLFSIAIFLNKNVRNIDAYLGLSYVAIAFLYVSGIFFAISPLIQKICVYYFIFWCELQNRHVMK